MPKELRASLDALQGGIRRRVVLMEFLNDDETLSIAYSAMDVFLHASTIGESFGMVLAESLLCGTPVITLSTPARDNSQLEIVGHERGGLVAANIGGMVSAMRRLASPDTRAQYADWGAAAIRANYCAEVLIPRAAQVATLCAEGLSAAELRRRVLLIPGLDEALADADIQNLMRSCIGDYSLSTLVLARLVANPHLYRMYKNMNRLKT
jgi:hypothetical protein